MKKLLVIMLFSLTLTGCNFQQVKENVEVKLKTTLAETVSNEFGIPEEVVMQYANNLSLSEIKSLVAAFNNGDYETIENILGDIDSLSGVVTEENVNEAMNFLSDVKTAVSEIDIAEIYSNNSEVIDKLKEQGIDIESLDLENTLYKYLPSDTNLLEDKNAVMDSIMDAAVDTYIKEYREKNLISDEEASKLAEEYKETLKQKITSE